MSSVPYPRAVVGRSCDNRADYSAIVARNARATELAMNIPAWLRGLGLGQYEEAFRDNAIGPDVLPRLTAEDLKELGVSLVGHRRKLLDAISLLRAEEAPAFQDQQNAPAASPAPADLIGERRQVTVLFADLAGFMAWGQQLDAEELHALIEQFFGCADRVILEH